MQALQTISFQQASVLFPSAEEWFLAMLAMFYLKIIGACLLRSTSLAGCCLRVKQGISDYALNQVNAIYPGLNLIVPSDKPGEQPKYGMAARGMSREYAEGLRDCKQTIFGKFQQPFSFA